MGKVRTKVVKRTAKEMLEKFPNKFTTNFEENKQVLMEVAEIPSKRLRNRIAGYITRLVKQRKRVEQQLAMRQEINLTEEEEYIKKIEGGETTATG